MLPMAWFLTTPLILSLLSDFAICQYVPNFFDNCSPGVPVIVCKDDPCLTSVCPGYPEAKCRTNLCGKCKAEFIQDKKIVDCSRTPEWFDNCPRDVPIVQCAIDPCIGKACSAYPQARCRTNLCGVCRAEFVLNDKVINCEAPPSNECPADKPLVACLRNPCQNAVCAAYPSAVCQTNYCGGCFAHFYHSGKKVNCTTEIPGSGMVGALDIQCDKTPYGCCEDGESAAKGSNKEGCPGVYTKCGVERRAAIVSNYRRRYTPTCNVDGTFTSIQCWKYTSVCWCVDFEGNEVDGTRAINRKPSCKRGDAVLAGPSTVNCRVSPFGCCSDGKTSATGPQSEGCPGEEAACWNTQYGCCPDGKTFATGPEFNDCQRQPSKCEVHRDEVVKMSGKPLTGAYIPQCKQDGAYDEIQCQGSTGFCWCADKEGSEVKDTKIRGRPDCSVIVPACVDLRKDCKSYLAYCSLFPKYMKTYCAKSCEYCSGNQIKIVTKKPTVKTTVSTTTKQVEMKTATPRPTVTAATKPEVKDTKKQTTKAPTAKPTTKTKDGCGSTFGCCLDGLVPALGPGYLGCPVYRSFCTMPAASGECRDAMKRFFYNAQQRTCEEFYYGGCGGNKNNFKTEEECEKACHKDSPKPGEVKETTTAKPELETSPSTTQKTTTTATVTTTTTPKPTTEAATTTVATTTTRATTTKVTTTTTERPTTHRSTTIATTAPPLTECQLRREAIVASSNRGLAYALVRGDVQLPRCDIAGSFYNVQCWPAMDTCWCVDDDGNEIENTSTTSTKKPKCPKRVEKCKNVRNDKLCSRFASYAGYCQLYESYMKRFCAKSCNLCDYEPKRPGCSSLYGCCPDGVTPASGRDFMGCPVYDSVCNMQPVPGPCYAYLQKYFYNGTSGKCEKFVYGGCKGNQNNFDSERGCQIRCVKEEPEITTRQPTTATTTATTATTTREASTTRIRTTEPTSKPTTSEVSKTEPTERTPGTTEAKTLPPPVVITESFVDLIDSIKEGIASVTPKPQDVLTTTALPVITDDMDLTTIASEYTLAVTTAAVRTSKPEVYATSHPETPVTSTEEPLVSTTSGLAVPSTAPSEVQKTTVPLPPTTKEVVLATTSEPEIQTTAPPEVPETAVPLPPTTKEVVVATTSEPEIQTTAPPEVPETAVPLPPTTKEVVVATTSEPKIQSTAPPEVPETAVPLLVTTKEVVVATTSEPEIQSTAPPEVPETAVPLLVTTKEVVVATTSEPEIQSTAPPEVPETAVPLPPTTKEVVVATTSEPEIQSTAPPEVPETAVPLPPTTKEVVVATTSEPEIQSTAPPEVPETAVPLPPTTKEVVVATTSEPEIQTTAPPEVPETAVPLPLTTKEVVVATTSEPEIQTTAPPEVPETAVPLPLTTKEVVVATTSESEIQATAPPEVPETAVPLPLTTKEVVVATTSEPEIQTTAPPEVPETAVPLPLTTKEVVVATTSEPELPSTFQPEKQATESGLSIQTTQPTLTISTKEDSITPMVISEPPTKCLLRRQMFLEQLSKAKSRPGLFVPKCDENGQFERIQCWKMISLCWCVGPHDGMELPGTRTNITLEGKPDCFRSQLTQCERDRITALKIVDSRRKEGETVFGFYIPTCDSGGDFDEVQCLSSNEKCWCVDRKSGKKVDGVAIPGNPICVKSQETKCQRVKKLAERLSKTEFGGIGIGSFIPSCEKDGSYSQIQCLGSTGYCWCVNEDGQEIIGTRKRGTPNCDKEEKPLTKCELDRKEALKDALIVDGKAIPPYDVYVPICEADGNFSLLQCNQFIGECWCVDEHGIEKKNTRTSEERPICHRAPSKCERKRKEIKKGLELGNVKDTSDRFLPTCDADGKFTEVQCWIKLNECWCVDEEGLEVMHTRVHGREPDCRKRNLTKCQKEIEAASREPAGSFSPECGRTGAYLEIQCYEGYCWCVDKSGTELEGTRTAFGNPVCQQVNLTKCQQERKDVEDLENIDGTKSVGAFSPECKEDGSYKDTQCHPSTGDCWCVDDEGKEVIGTRYHAKTPECRRLLGSKLSGCEYKKRFLLTRQKDNRDWFIPQCHVNGSYFKQQCNDATGHCWCVNEEGKMTKWIKKGQTVEICYQEPRTECEIQRELVYNLAFMINRMFPLLPRGAFLPSCDENGAFQDTQCHEGYCWCVNKYGKEVVDTRKRFEKPECSRLLAGDFTLCERQRFNSLQEKGDKSKEGRYLPQCLNDGEYKRMQCNVAKGRCWCVDENGEMTGWVKRNETGHPYCSDLYGNVTKCQMRQREVYRKARILNNQYPALPLGIHLPECTKDGSFNMTQCNEGYCWCVDQNGDAFTQSLTRFKHPNCERLLMRNLTKCELLRDAALLEHSNGDTLNRFIVNCDENGAFVKLQCNADIGSCWCVNQDGITVDGTITKLGRSNCTITRHRTRCQRRRQNVLDRSVIGPDGLTVPLPGEFVPECKDDGSYENVQCHDSDGSCWCVDEDGAEMINTRGKDKNINCTISINTLCEKKRQEAYHVANIIDGRHSIGTGAYIPQCNEKGQFKETQCHGSTGYCWCVDSTGQKIPNTSLRFKKPQCKRLLAGNFTKCELRNAIQRGEDKTDAVQDRFLFDCNVDGSFVSKQCDGFLGTCWCVNEQGATIDGSETSFGQPNCSPRNNTACQQQRQDLLNKAAIIGGRSVIAPGTYVPQCTSEGKFEMKQCYGSTGFCWCVDENGDKLKGFAGPGRALECKKAKLTKCQRQLREATMNSNVPVEEREFPNNIYAPDCEDDGSYAKMQCHDFDESCFCVTETGSEVVHTRVTSQKPECERILAGNLTKCERERTLGTNGNFVAKCKVDGRYAEVQCDSSSERCWCVDENGVKISGIEATDGNPNCQKGKPLTKCQKRLEDSRKKARVIDGNRMFPPGLFVPSCNDDGSFASLQCHGSTGYCFCYSDDGIEIPYTRFQFEKPECERIKRGNFSQCELERIRGPVPDRVNPKCRTDGQYEQVQCHGSTGYCWCVNEKGEKIADTETKGSQPNCAQLTKCQSLAKELNALGTVINGTTVLPPGTFVPKCNKDGAFEVVQCHPSTGYCWCVDEVGSEILHTKTRQGKPDCQRLTANNLTVCEKHRKEGIESLMNNGSISFVPRCHLNGAFSDLQCWQGDCWCVDEKGIVVIGTKSKSRLNCEDVKEDKSLPPTTEARTAPPASVEPQFTQEASTAIRTTEVPTTSEDQTLPQTKEVYTAPPASVEPQFTQEASTAIGTTEAPTTSEDQTLPQTKEAYTAPPASVEPQLTQEARTAIVTTEVPTTPEDQTLPQTKEVYTAPPASVEPQFTQGARTAFVTTEVLTTSEDQTLPQTKEVYTAPPASVEPQFTQEARTAFVTTEVPTTSEDQTLPQTKEVYTAPPASVEPQFTQEARTAFVTTEVPTTSEDQTLPQTKEMYTAPPASVEPQFTQEARTAFVTTEVPTTSEDQTLPQTKEVYTAPPASVEPQFTQEARTEVGTTEPPPLTTEASATVTTEPPPLTTEASATVTTEPPPLTTEASATVTTEPPPLPTEASATVTTEPPPLPTEASAAVTTEPPPLTTEASATVTTEPPPLTTEASAAVTTEPPPLTTEASAAVTTEPPPTKENVTTESKTIATTTAKPFVVTASSIATEKPTKHEITTAIFKNDSTEAPFHLSACFLPRDPGPCEAEMVRYHYNDDSNVKDCVGFIFGGCNGNANNFKTAEECVSQCRDRIGLKTTSKAITKETKVVKRIPGCNSTFGCCDDYITPATGPNQAGCPAYQSVCEYPPAKGYCKAKITRFYYNARLKVCNSFIWGGCFANRNNFPSYESCMQKCEGHVPAHLKKVDEDVIVQTKFIPGCVGEFGCCEDGVSPAKGPNQEGCPVYESICNMPAVKGYCRDASIIRWHYDTVSGRCDTFRYSGCGGNQNNFNTPNQCAEKCEIGGPRCQDKIQELCGDWKERGFCTSRWHDMVKYCQRTCGFCNKRR